MLRGNAKAIDGTRLVRGRSAPNYDREVLDIIHSLPTPRPGGTLRIIGVADQSGQIYRRIDLFCPLEVLVVQAKLNAAGFRQHAGWRRELMKDYEGVYVKRRL